MNKVILMGRLTRDPETRYSQRNNGEQMAIAKISLAVDRKRANRNDPNAVTADFFNCTAFGKTGEFVDKYLKKGTKVVVTGSVQNDNYTNKDGQKVYGVQIMVEEIEFAESKQSQEQNEQPTSEGFMDVPDGIENDLPFK